MIFEEFLKTIVEVASYCPRQTKDDKKVVFQKLKKLNSNESEQFFKDNPEFGSEKLCEGCPWHLKNAPDFLNCSLVVQQMGECSVAEISRMEGDSQTQIQYLINKAQLNFIKIVEKRGYDAIGRLYSRKWGIPYRGKFY